MRRRTLAGPALRVLLYEKPGCGLCTEAYRVLARLRMDVSLEIERVDIESDPKLFRRYALRIPVVSLGDQELDVAGLDEAAVRRWVSDRTR